MAAPQSAPLPQPLAALAAGTRVVAQLATRQVLRGSVRSLGDGWLTLETDDGEVLLNLDHVVLIGGDGGELPEAPAATALPKPQSKERPVKVGSRAPGRPWPDADLKALANGFLDGATDSELAERHHRTRHQITTLRQGFECARGNLVDDQLSPVAQTWIERWQRVLAG